MSERKAKKQEKADLIAVAKLMDLVEFGRVGRCYRLTYDSTTGRYDLRRRLS